MIRIAGAEVLQLAQMRSLADAGDTGYQKIYTVTAPSFSRSISAVFDFLGVTDGAAVSSKIINFWTADGVSLTAVLGQVLRTVQEVRIEAPSFGPIDHPVYYHSIKTLTHTLSVYCAMADLQPTLTVE